MVGEKLETLLEMKGIKPGTLATMTGISKSTIYSIIKRNNKNVDFSTMEKIADALDVPVEYFHERTVQPDDLTISEPTVTYDPEAVMNLFNQLTDTEQEFIISSMRGIIADRH